MSGCAAKLPLRFEGRIGGVDGVIADEWGRLVARREARGRHIHAMDALIAATTLVHGLKSLLNHWK